MMWWNFSKEDINEQREGLAIADCDPWNANYNNWFITYEVVPDLVTDGEIIGGHYVSALSFLAIKDENKEDAINRFIKWFNLSNGKYFPERRRTITVLSCEFIGEKEMDF